jgi:LEA14-like dessication related protein
MNSKLIIGLGAMAAAALYYFKGKKEAIEKIQITPLDIAINSQKTKWNLLVFNLKLKIGNPSNFKVNINNIDLDVIINNKKISEFQKTGITSVEAKNAKTISIEISVQSLAIVDVVLNAIADDAPINVQLLGNIGTDLGTAIIDFKKQINV